MIKLNTRVCAAAGPVYMHQLSVIYLDMLNVYKLYSEQVIQACASQGGEYAARYTIPKAMRAAKGDILELMCTFLEQCSQMEGGTATIIGQILPPLMQEVLPDYRNSPPAARDAGVLNLFATATAVLKEAIAPQIPLIMEAIFEPTLHMISTDMINFPEHRFGFFRSQHSLTCHSLAPHLPLTCPSLAALDYH